MKNLSQKNAKLAFVAALLLVAAVVALPVAAAATQLDAPADTCGGGFVGDACRLVCSVIVFLIDSCPL